MAFSPIALGQTVCGESGVFPVGGKNVPDQDWYELARDVRRALPRIDAALQPYADAVTNFVFWSFPVAGVDIPFVLVWLIA